GDRVPGARYVATQLTILLLGTGERTQGVLAHEAVHVEAVHRAGHRRMPAWFHEGLAVLVGGEPDCSQREGRGLHDGGDPQTPATGVDDLRRLDRFGAWEEYTDTRDKREETYCQARAEVDAWVRRSGKARLFELFGKVRDGVSFEEAYGPMQTQAPGPI